MQLKHVALLSLPLLTVGIACSNGFSSFDSFPSASGVGGTATPPPGAFGSSGTPCPSTAPTSGTQCNGPLRCEYGDSASSDCNTVAVCASGVFDVTYPSTTTCDDRCPSFDAPGALATAQGKACLHGSRGNLVCGSPYDRSTCGCVDPSTIDGGAPASDGGTMDAAAGDPDASDAASDAFGDGGGAALPDVPGVWLCVTPALGCPATRPAVGTACVREMVCDYGACVFPGGMKLACATPEGDPSASLWIDQTPIACGGQK